MKYTSEKSWYVLRVRSQSESMVHQGLNRKQFQVLNPTFQTISIRKDRRKLLSKPIFKGYIFIKAILNPIAHLEILKTPGVVEILKSQNGPTPVPEEQIENVCLLEKHVGNCFFGKNISVGDPVIVREGPLTGLRGLINKINRKNMHICVDAVEGSIMIEVEPTQVQVENDSIYSLMKCG